MQKNLYIAVETKNRELYAKVLLACVAAEKGFSTVIGVNTEIRENLSKWPAGFVLWKGLARKGGNTYRYFHSLGHLAIAWCEEGLVYPGSEFYKRYRVFPEALNEVDLFFAWGENQAKDIISKVPEGKNKVHITGNPRIDILGSDFRAVYSDEVKEIRKKYSPYILINTNFSAYTHKLGSDAVIASLKKAGRIRSDEDELFYRGRAENRKTVFNSFTKMIATLSSEYQDVSIILRPHISESIEVWEKAVAGFKNVYLLHQGSVMPWILASEILIHNDCTTGLEAYLLEKPVISFRPTAGNPYESELPIKVSKSIEKIDELVRDISKILHGDNIDIDDAGDIDITLKYYIGNYKCDYSVERIVDELENYIDTSTKNEDCAKTYYRRIFYWFRKSARKVQSFVADDRRDNKFIGREKFPGLSSEEVEKIIRDLGEKKNCFHGLYVTPVRGTKTCIKIQSNKK